MSVENGPEYSPEETAYWCGRCEERDRIVAMIDAAVGKELSLEQSGQCALENLRRRIFEDYKK